MFSRRTLIAAITLSVFIIASPAYTQDKFIVVASTTSAQDSGLFEYLLPIFKQKTGITVKVLAEGSGRSLDTARRGDADVVFVHSLVQFGRVAAIQSGTSWTLTPILQLATTLPLWQAEQTLTTRVVFRPEPYGGAWAIDDVYVDPYSR